MVYRAMPLSLSFSTAALMLQSRPLFYFSIASIFRSFFFRSLFLSTSRKLLQCKGVCLSCHVSSHACCLVAVV